MSYRDPGQASGEPLVLEPDGTVYRAGGTAQYERRAGVRRHGRRGGAHRHAVRRTLHGNRRRMGPDRPLRHHGSADCLFKVKAKHPSTLYEYYLFWEAAMNLMFIHTKIKYLLHIIENGELDFMCLEGKLPIWCVVGVSWWGHKVDNAYWIWNFQGRLMHKQPMERFCQLLWRPRPHTLLNKEQLKVKLHTVVFHRKNRPFDAKPLQTIFRRKNRPNPFRFTVFVRRVLHIFIIKYFTVAIPIQGGELHPLGIMCAFFNLH